MNLSIRIKKNPDNASTVNVSLILLNITYEQFLHVADVARRVIGRRLAPTRSVASTAEKAISPIIEGVINSSRM